MFPRTELLGFLLLRYLKWLSQDKGEVLQLSLLFPPLLLDAAVPDDHPLPVLVEARVEVKGQVFCCVQIDGDPKEQQRPSHSPETTGF